MRKVLPQAGVYAVSLLAVLAGPLAGLPAGLLPTAVAAQGDVAYDSLEVGLHYNFNVNQNDFHQFWDPGGGAGLYLTTPFHTGYLWIGTRYWPNAGKAPDIPDIKSAYVFAGWSYRLALPLRLTLEPGFSLGLDVFAVEGEQNAGLEFETEVAGELFVRAGYPLRGKWRLNVSGSSLKILTRRRIELLFVSVGLSRSFSTPDWMRDILK